MLSDTLFSFILTLCVACTIAWFQSPSATWAAAIGAALARPSWSNRRHNWPGARRGGNAACRRLGPVFPQAPCALGLRLDCRRSGGIALVYSQPGLFRIAILDQVHRPLAVGFVLRGKPRPAGAPIPLADGPATQEVLSAATDVDPHNTWEVYKSLLRGGYSQIAADDLMLAAAKEGLAAHPGKYAANLLVRAAWFWITPNGTVSPLTGDFARTARRMIATGAGLIRRARKRRGRFSGDRHGTSRKGGSTTYGFRTRCFMPWPPERLSRRSSCGCANMRLGFALGAWFAYFTAISILGSRPGYRHRMILEPTMIIAAVTAAECLLARWRPDNLDRPQAGMGEVKTGAG